MMEKGDLLEQFEVPQRHFNKAQREARAMSERRSPFSNKYLGILLLLFTSHGFCYDMPVPKFNELAVIVLDDSQMLSLLSIENYSSLVSPLGVCFGIDRVNYTLLTKIKFIPGERDSNSSIRDKILLAYLNNSNQTISGFYSIDDFMDVMEDEWDDKNNALKQVIDVIQVSQNGFEYSRQIDNRNQEFGEQGVQYLAHEADSFEKYILEGVPVTVAIRNEKLSHQITIIGLKKRLNSEDSVKDFYVLDSNDPDHLQILSLKNRTWHYKDWITEHGGPRVSVIWKEPNAREIAEAKKHFKSQILVSKETLALLNFKILLRVRQMW